MGTRGENVSLGRKLVARVSVFAPVAVVIAGALPGGVDAGHDWRTFPQEREAILSPSSLAITGTASTTRC